MQTVKAFICRHYTSSQLMYDSLVWEFGVCVCVCVCVCVWCVCVCVCVGVGAGEWMDRGLEFSNH